MASFLRVWSGWGFDSSFSDSVSDGKICLCAFSPVALVVIHCSSSVPPNEFRLTLQEFCVRLSSFTLNV